MILLGGTLLNFVTTLLVLGFSFAGDVIPPGCGTLTSLDLNGDATVDVVDLLEVVGSWGESNVPADINGDGIVDVSDLLAVVDSWGPC